KLRNRRCPEPPLAAASDHRPCGYRGTYSGDGRKKQQSRIAPASVATALAILLGDPFVGLLAVSSSRNHAALKCTQ
ncbi:MAG: hypothetical protein WBE89_10700, partial [Methyloceanibacter sp.]